MAVTPSTKRSVAVVVLIEVKSHLVAAHIRRPPGTRSDAKIVITGRDGRGSYAKSKKILRISYVYGFLQRERRVLKQTPINHFPLPK